MLQEGSRAGEGRVKSDKEKEPTIEMVLSPLFRLNLNPPNEHPQSVTLATQSSKAKRKWKEGRYVCLSV